MIKDLFVKIVQFVVAMLVLSILIFYMARLSPGNPLRAYYGDRIERMSTEEKDAAITRLGLDQPIIKQYELWFRNAIVGDFGKSFKYKEDVIKIIGETYINTLILAGIGYVIIFILALKIGIYCAMHEESIIDKAIFKIGTVTTSIPPFWISLILILIFSVNLKLLPSSGAYSIGEYYNLSNRIMHLIMPMLVLCMSHIWYYAYLVRNKMMDEIRKDYVLSLKAKGLTKKDIVYKHCLRNAIPVYITMMALSIPHILGGTYVIEMVFAYQGIGSLCFESAKFHDYNMLMVLTLITGAVVIFSNMLANYLNKLIDPRTKKSGEVIVWT